MPTKNRYIFCGLAVLALLVCLAMFYCPPEENDFWPKCQFHELTGLYCPGCGNTRALFLLLHGDIKGSLAKNPLLLPAIMVITILLWRPRIAMNVRFAYAVSAMAIGFFVLRNIPLYPFTLLAPH